MNNPYTLRGPVNDARMFFGRAQELDEIGAFLRGSQSVALVGPRKIGKTSLMLHLKRAETQAALGIGAENLFVYIDCRALSACSQAEIIASMAVHLAAELHGRGLTPEPSLSAAASNPTWAAFDMALRRLGQPGLRVVLMLDGFEHIAANPLIGLNFFNALRSVAGHLPLAFLTGSALPLIELTCFNHAENILSSPFFNIFATVFLGLLTEAEAGELICTPLQAAARDVSAQLQNFIFQLVGGHPLGLQTACFHAWKDPADLASIDLLTRQDLESHFRDTWQNLSPLEQDVLRRAAGGEMLQANSPLEAARLRNLARQCLVARSDGAYRLPSKAWAAFISSNF